MHVHPKVLRNILRLAVPTGLILAAPLAVAHDGPHAPPDPIGKAETARWTETTYEAAASEANKQVLASGKVATVTGEIVDVSCYMQLGKRGEAHVACGTKCIMNGMPIGIVDADDNLYVLFPEEHHPRRDGEVGLAKVLVPYLAKTVTVTGMMTEMKGYHALFIQAAEVGGAMGAVPAAPRAPAVEGTAAAPKAPKAPDAPKPAEPAKDGKTPETRK